MSGRRRAENMTEADYEAMRRLIQIALLDYVKMPATIDAAQRVVAVVATYLEGERVQPSRGNRPIGGRDAT